VRASTRSRALHAAHYQTWIHAMRETSDMQLDVFGLEAHVKQHLKLAELRRQARRALLFAWALHALLERPGQWTHPVDIPANPVVHISLFFIQSSHLFR